MDKIQINEQTKSAFDFVEKIYSECAYLVKEIEGLLQREDEKFIIGKQRGYQISASSSLGLRNPEQWMYKKLCAFFVPASMTKKAEGRTETSFAGDLKIIYLLIILSEDKLKIPQIAIGVLSEFKKFTKKIPKVEYFVIPYMNKIWDFIGKHGSDSKEPYKDLKLKFKAKFVIKDLFDINSVQDVEKKLINPALRYFRQA
jgi:hypothetical protein